MIRKNKRGTGDAAKQMYFLESEGYIVDKITPEADSQEIIGGMNQGLAQMDTLGSGANFANLISLFVRFALFPLHWAAVTFEAFLHIKFGRAYINPLIIVCSILFSIPFLFIAGGFGGAILAMGVGYGLSEFLNSFKFLCISAITLMLFHYIYALATYEKAPRHSRSSGVPWIYSLTKNWVFLTPFYTLYVEPIIVISVTLIFRFVFDFEEIIFVTLLAIAYLIRNIVTHQLLIMERIKRNDLLLVSTYEELADKVNAEIRQKNMNTGMKKAEGGAIAEGENHRNQDKFDRFEGFKE